MSSSKKTRKSSRGKRRAARAQKVTHKPVWGTKHIGGYLKKEGGRYFLTDWHGKDAGWIVDDEQHAYTNDFGEKSYAVVLTSTKSGREGRKYAVGYYLGDGGDLVRAETAPEWTEKRRDKGEFDLQELRRWAKDVSEYWFNVDEEDRRREESVALDEERFEPPY